MFSALVLHWVDSLCIPVSRLLLIGLIMTLEAYLTKNDRLYRFTTAVTLLWYAAPLLSSNGGLNLLCAIYMVEKSILCRGLFYLLLRRERGERFVEVFLDATPTFCMIGMILLLHRTPPLWWFVALTIALPNLARAVVERADILTLPIVLRVDILAREILEEGKLRLGQLCLY